jgi:[ribosomal protein S18]-alanine N-acetyltransferase
VTYLLTRANLEDLPEMILWESEIFGTDAWSPELLVAEISYPDNYYLVAKKDEHDAVVGYAGLRAPLRGGDQGDIQTLAVEPAHRGGGLGRMLLEALLHEARARGIREVFLEVRADNEAAIGLYESSGFQSIDRRVGYYQPDGVDAIVMRLELAPPEAGWAVGRA